MHLTANLAAITRSHRKRRLDKRRRILALQRDNSLIGAPPSLSLSHLPAPHTAQSVSRCSCGGAAVAVLH